MPDRRNHLRHQLLIRFGDRADFLRAYQSAPPSLGFPVLEEEGDLQPGYHVSLEILLVKELMTFRVPGVVLSRLAPHGDDVRSGIRVGFEHGPDHPTMRPMMEFIHGQLAGLVVRRPRRVVIGLPVEFTDDVDFQPGVLEDLSRGGAFVATEKPCPVGTLLALRVTLEGRDDPIRLTAEVTRTQKNPPGMGLSLLVGDPDVQAHLDTVMAHAGALTHRHEEAKGGLGDGTDKEDSPLKPRGSPKEPESQ